ncbi:hypothetical protein OAI05_04060 [Planktomarina temperata]|nr:hypothetical protein [Planktomarina temperata]
MKHTEKDVEKLASTLTKFGKSLNKGFLWREQKAAYKALAGAVRRMRTRIGLLAQP